MIREESPTIHFILGVFNLIISRTAIFLRSCSHPVEYFNYTIQFEKNLFPIINKRILFRYKGVSLYQTKLFYILNDYLLAKGSEVFSIKRKKLSQV